MPVEHLDDEVGAVILTEEALTQPDWSALVGAISNQPSWSSYPFILLIGQRRSAQQPEAVYALLPLEVANVTVLERPMSSMALVSAVRWAIAGRKRQFVTRDHLGELERKTSHQRLMTRELAHRVKNTIAMLQSIVTQTMRPFPETDLQTKILERFSALSRTHDLLLSTDFAAADFRDVVDNVLSIHGNVFDIAGPRFMLPPQAALSFSLVLNELATNSIKYGSLSPKARDGTVFVHWNTGDSTSEAFRFFWTEAGGPPVRALAQIGFGSKLIRSTLAGLGKVELAYPSTGFSLSFTGHMAALTHSVVPDELRQ
jgi:two-component sensor histidine kinase